MAIVQRSDEVTEEQRELEEREGQEEQQGRRERAAVAEVVTRYEAAFNQNDAEAMNALFSPDAAFVNFSGTLVFGAERLHRAQALVFAEGGPLEKVSVRYSVESVAFLTPGVAVVHARQQSTPPESQLAVAAGELDDGPDGGLDEGPDGDPMAGVLTMTLTRNAFGEWHIRAAQNTLVATAP